MAAKTNAVRLVEAANIPCRESFYEYDEKDLRGTHAANAIGMPEEQVFKTLVARGEKTGINVFCINNVHVHQPAQHLLDSLLPDESPVSRQLDVNVLHTAILERLLGIDKENMAQQINLTYTRVTEEAIDGVKNGTYQCAILLNPTRVSEIQGVAAAGEKMPQKSTYFYPKLITGLTMNELD